MNSRLPRASLWILAALVLPACEKTVNNDSPLFATTVRVSVGVDGQEANDGSLFPSISGDGSRVVFVSIATNLHPDDTDAHFDVYVRDLVGHRTLLVSRASGAAGAKSNGTCLRSAISPDGRYVVFDSTATNLDPDDTDGGSDIYLRDLEEQTTTLISRDSTGAKLAGGSSRPAMSDDARYFVFLHPTLGPGYVYRDNLLGITTTVATVNSPSGLSLSGDGQRIAYQEDASGLDFEPDPLNPTPGTIANVFARSLPDAPALVSRFFPGLPMGAGPSRFPKFSGDGGSVVFDSESSLFAGFIGSSDNNLAEDVYVWNRVSGEVSRASLTAADADGNRRSFGGSISADGRFVAFESEATNMVNDDLNGLGDVFVRDRVEGTTRRVSVRTFGGEANDQSGDARISRDGRWVVFYSDASNMVGDDTNTVRDIFVRGPLY